MVKASLSFGAQLQSRCERIWIVEIYPSKLNHNSNHWLWILFKLKIIQFYNSSVFNSVLSSIAFKDEQVTRYLQLEVWQCRMAAAEAQAMPQWNSCREANLRTSEVLWASVHFCSLITLKLDIWDFFNSGPQPRNKLDSTRPATVHNMYVAYGRFVFSYLTSTKHSSSNTAVQRCSKWPVFHSVAHAGVSMAVHRSVQLPEAGNREPFNFSSPI